VFIDQAPPEVLIMGSRWRDTVNRPRTSVAHPYPTRVIERSHGDMTEPLDTTETALRPLHRMPVTFGPAPGPRNVPPGAWSAAGPERRTEVAFTVEIRAEEVDRLLPRGLSLLDATMTVRVQKLSNLRWLAGRGYDIVSVTFPVEVSAHPRPFAADYLAVLWENMAEPIITGREELGFPKLFADIHAPNLELGAPSFSATASWDGTTFFEAGVDDLHDTPAPSAAPVPIVTHRYLPAVGRLTESEIDQLTITDPPGRPAPAVVRSATGSGHCAFAAVSWLEHPVQQPVINALAALRVAETAAVQVTCIEGEVAAVGNRRLELAGPSPLRRPG
jgi:hypothetical protein